MQNHYSIKINFKGGIVQPRLLKQILKIAAKASIREVRFGLRQQMIWHLPHALSRTSLSRLRELNVAFEIDENKFPNIVSSYVAEEVFQKGNWLSEGIYKDIFDLFDYEPRLKINISDGQQSFTPFFSGHLNFIASSTPNFWYLTARLPKTNEVHSFNKLIFTNEIANVCRILENAISEKNFETDVFKLWNEIPQRTIFSTIEKPLELPHFSLPYYEGFNRYDKKTWLGIYRRDEQYSVNFLLEMCEIALETHINEICITPWKSLIIKGISEQNRGSWSNLLAKYNLNVRHAANELNWQIEDDSEDALRLKLEIIEQFNKEDLRTFGICFGIKTIPKTEVFASIMVRRRRFKMLNLLPLFYVYDISYTQDFDPNGRTKIYFEEGILRFNLVEQLRRSVMLYNKKQAENAIVKIEKPMKVIDKQEVIERRAHQCKHCLTIYDEQFGDILNDIPVGIPFKSLAETYICPTCEAPKNDFVEITSNKFAMA